MKALEGGTRTAFLGFFASHIVFTLLVDGQALFRAYYPPVLQKLLTTYVTTLQDPIMTEPFDLWLQSMIVCEFLFQMPYFLIAVSLLSDPTLQTIPLCGVLLPVASGRKVPDPFCRMRGSRR